MVLSIPRTPYSLLTTCNSNCHLYRSRPLSLPSPRPLLLPTQPTFPSLREEPPHVLSEQPDGPSQ